VGINTLILSQSGGSEGIGFAAPSNIVRAVYEQLRDTGTVSRGAVGVHAQTITPALARALGLPRDWGVIVGDVFPNGPAEKAGLRIGDMIVSMDGKVMENGRQFDVNVYRRRIGESVDLAVLRDGKSLRLSVKVIARPAPATRFLTMVDPERNLVPELGILVLDRTPEIERLLPSLRRKTGVVVAGRSAEAPFWKGGLLPGDVIYAINNKPVGRIDDMRRIVGALKAYDAVVIQIERQGHLQFVAFEFE
jgi:serine protease Do